VYNESTVRMDVALVSAMCWLNESLAVWSPERLKVAILGLKTVELYVRCRLKETEVAARSWPGLEGMELDDEVAVELEMKIAV
jgi:hypothetical protein